MESRQVNQAVAEQYGNPTVQSEATQYGTEATPNGQNIAMGDQVVHQPRFDAVDMQRRMQLVRNMEP